MNCKNVKGTTELKKRQVNVFNHIAESRGGNTGGSLQ